MNTAFDKIRNLDKRSKELFRIIQKYGPITKNMLETITQMKKSTLNRTLEVLLEGSIINEAATGESTGGRKPSLFDINENIFYIVGVDISRTYIQIMIANLKMSVVEEKIIYGAFNLTKQEEIIVKNIYELLEKASIDITKVLGIGLGVVVYANKTEAADNAENLKKYLQDKFTLPVYLDNGANTALLAEYNFGAGKDKQNILYVHCGVGIRTAVISNGNVVRTINNEEDALGHMTVQLDGDLCSCGNYGCVESYASITKITSKFISEIKKGKKTKLEKPLDKVDYIDICNLAEEGDETAKYIIKDASVYLGAGLANIVRVLAPNLIILSGPLIKNSSIFYETSMKEAIKRCCNWNTEHIQFYRGGSFENKSIVMGAAYLVLDEVLKIF